MLHRILDVDWLLLGGFRLLGATATRVQHVVEPLLLLEVLLGARVVQCAYRAIWLSINLVEIFVDLDINCGIIVHRRIMHIHAGCLFNCIFQVLLLLTIVL